MANVFVCTYHRWWEGSCLQGLVPGCCTWWRESGVERGRSWLKRRPCEGRTGLMMGRPAALQTPYLSNTIRSTPIDTRQEKKGEKRNPTHATHTPEPLFLTDTHLNYHHSNTVRWPLWKMFFMITLNKADNSMVLFIDIEMYCTGKEWLVLISTYDWSMILKCQKFAKTS